MYSLCRVGHHHHHSVCIQCGAVEEFRATAAERLISAVSSEILGGEVIDHRIELQVVCRLCPSDGGKQGLVSTDRGPNPFAVY